MSEWLSPTPPDIADPLSVSKNRKMEPPFRFSTKTALDELAIELDLRERIPSWDAVAGYSYTPSNPADIQQYIEYYDLLKDEDKRFTLIEMILDALADQPNENEFTRYWDKVKPILIKDSSIHNSLLETNDS